MKKIDRREFIEKSAKFGMLSLIGGQSVIGSGFNLVSAAEEKKIDLSVVTGTDYFANTIMAVEKLGGIGVFVPKGARVALLINSSFKHPGSYTRPDVALAIAFLCKEGGAKEICLLKGEGPKYWNRSQRSKKHQSLIRSLIVGEEEHETISIKKGINLKEADVLKGFLDYDVVINIPIAKNHSGTNYTGTLKNLMGLCPFTTNIKFHMGPNYISTFVKEWGDFYSKLDNLNQCIADLNTIRTIELNVVDATEFITTNGPFGPGELKKQDTIVAGADRVAVDAWCCTYLGQKATDVSMIKRANAHGIGQMDMTQLNIGRFNGV